MYCNILLWSCNKILDVLLLYYCMTKLNTTSLWYFMSFSCFWLSICFILYARFCEIFDLRSVWYLLRDGLWFHLELWLCMNTNLPIFDWMVHVSFVVVMGFAFFIFSDILFNYFWTFFQNQISIFVLVFSDLKTLSGGCTFMKWKNKRIKPLGLFHILYLLLPTLHINHL